MKDKPDFEFLYANWKLVFILSSNNLKNIKFRSGQCSKRKKKNPESLLLNLF